jgi:hypothetical protein
MAFSKLIGISTVVTSAGVLALCAALGAACEATQGAGSGDGDGDGDSDTDSDTSDCTTEGEHECDGDDYLVCTDGVWTLVESCPTMCDATLGCVECIPSDTTCDGDVVMICNDDGMGYTAGEDCTAAGQVCWDGVCVDADPCQAAFENSSNIGCEYWAVDLDNAQNSFDDAASGQFAVAVANIGSNGPATVSVEINNAAQGASLDLELVEQHVIEELGLYVFLLPRRDVDGGDFTDNHVDDGPQTRLSSDAFRITSDVPVVAYQFNTLDQQFSNDASLLLPTSALGKDHLVLGYSPSGPTDTVGSPKNHGYITIVGAYEGTAVTVTPSFDIMAGEGIDAITAGTPTNFTIGPFDVVNLETRFVTLGDLAGGNFPDLSGTTVTSDSPVAVFFGTDLSVVTDTELFSDTDDSSCCAEHLEEQILPSLAMGQKFVVSHSAMRSSGTPEEDYYRVMAYQTATVTTSLPAPNDSFTLAAGEYKEFFTNQGFVMQTADGYLHVAQFLVSGGDVPNPIGGAGDPSLMYIPAVDQRRGLYVFTTGVGFSYNAAVISMPADTVATIDGLDVATSCTGPRSDGEIDGVAYEAWECEIADGAHTVYSGTDPDSATIPIGVYFYSYYNAGSIAYPAGSDLRHTNPVVVE